MSEALSGGLDILKVNGNLSERAKLAQAARRLEALDAEIERINTLLAQDDSLRIVPETHFGKPTPVYVYDAENDTITQKGELFTEGASLDFIANKLVVHDDQVIGVNTENGYGIPVWGTSSLTLTDESALINYTKHDNEYLVGRFNALEQGETLSEDHLQP